MQKARKVISQGLAAPRPIGFDAMPELPRLRIFLEVNSGLAYMCDCMGYSELHRRKNIRLGHFDLSLSRSLYDCDLGTRHHFVTCYRGEWYIYQIVVSATRTVLDRSFRV